MKRGELGAALFAVLFGAGAVAAILVSARFFATNVYATGISTFLGLLSGPSLLIAVGVAAWSRWACSCQVAWCLRRGEHPVAGTTVKVCCKHHTREVHEDLAEACQVPGQLGWGESVTPPPAES